MKKLFKYGNADPIIFDIKGQKKAAKILTVSAKTLSNKIKKGDILKINIHYTISKTGYYSFNRDSLLLVKGLI